MTRQQTSNQKHIWWQYVWWRKIPFPYIISKPIPEQNTVWPKKLPPLLPSMAAAAPERFCSFSSFESGPDVNQPVHSGIDASYYLQPECRTWTVWCTTRDARLGSKDVISVRGLYYTILTHKETTMWFVSCLACLIENQFSVHLVVCTQAAKQPYCYFPIVRLCVMLFNLRFSCSVEDLAWSENK